jgi:ornithine carbamoyltransferase
VTHAAKRDFLEIDDLTALELDAVLAQAAAVKADRTRLEAALAGKSVAVIFEKPSTRTRVSFEVGIAQLGGTPVVLRAGEMQIGRGETVPDTARTLSRYVDAIVARVNHHEDLVELALHASVPVVNALSDRAHPCQALADLQTLAENNVGRVAYVGDGNNVAHSLLLGCALRRIPITLACPEGYEPDPAVLTRAAEWATVVHDPSAAVEGAQAVYTDVWISMGDEAEEAARRKAFAGYTVTPDLVPPGAIFLHDLPAHRGEEVVDEVIDGPASRVWDQAENRLHAQKALLAFLVAGVGHP